MRRRDVGRHRGWREPDPRGQGGGGRGGLTVQMIVRWSALSTPLTQGAMSQGSPLRINAYRGASRLAEASPVPVLRGA